MSSAETGIDIVANNPVILISADLPGCGSSTLAERLGEEVTAMNGNDAHTIFVGQEIRRILGVSNDAELHEKLAEVDDPHSFDPQVYSGLPVDRTCIVEGKLATVAGPQFVEQPERPVIAIDLTSSPLFSAKRILQREGHSLAVLFGESPDDGIIEQLERIDSRTAHDDELRRKIGEGVVEASGLQIVRHSYDTSQFSVEEIVNDVLGNANYRDTLPAWELEALDETLKTLTLLGLESRTSMNPQDKTHFDHQLESIAYNIDRLQITLNPQGLEQIRADLKKSITDCWFGLMLKRAPRFNTDIAGTTTFDTESHAWSPEYYKIAEGWPTLSTMLKDKVILDPFAGAGTLMNLMIA